MTEKLPSDLDYSTAAEQSSEEDEAQEGNTLDADLHSVDAVEHSAMHLVDESDEPDLDGLLDALEAAADPEADAIVDDALDIDSADEAEAAAEATHDEADEPETDAEPAEVDPYDEFKLELRMKPGKWYVVHSYAGFEKRVKQNIENRKISMNMEESIYEVQVPMEDVVEIKNGQRKLVTRVRIPSYVLVRMDLNEDSWSVVRHTPGVTGFVGNAHNPTPLRFDEAFQMLKSTVQVAEAPAKAGGA
ncbi:MAG: transcription termination/antitermination protein NusG, partial [Microbacteriaceae bacterium]|nr:transcription termination/antitermination protein NusG [Microbacteriaceae bacterium]